MTLLKKVPQLSASIGPPPLQTTLCAGTSAASRAPGATTAMEHLAQMPAARKEVSARYSLCCPACEPFSQKAMLHTVSPCYSHEISPPYPCRLCVPSNYKHHPEADVLPGRDVRLHEWHAASVLRRWWVNQRLVTLDCSAQPWYTAVLHQGRRQQPLRLSKGCESALLS